MIAKLLLVMMGWDGPTHIKNLLTYNFFFVYIFCCGCHYSKRGGCVPYQLHMISNVPARSRKVCLCWACSEIVRGFVFKQQRNVYVPYSARIRVCIIQVQGTYKPESQYVRSSCPPSGLDPFAYMQISVPFCRAVEYHN